MNLIRIAGGLLFALALVIVVLLVREGARGIRSPGWAARFATASGLLLIGVAYAFMEAPMRDWVALFGLFEVVAGLLLERAVGRAAARVDRDGEDR